MADYLAPLMFVSLVLFLLFGYPVAFALAANGLVFAIIGIQQGLLTPELLSALRPHSTTHGLIPLLLLLPR